MRNKVLAVLFSIPATPTDVFVVSAAVSTGKFCRSFTPPSASPASLSVTPSPIRSMPSAPFALNVLPSTAFPDPDQATTPCCVLNAIRLPAPAAVPPTVLLLVSKTTP